LNPTFGTTHKEKVAILMDYVLSILVGCGWVRPIKQVYGATIAAWNEVAKDVNGPLDAGVPQLLYYIKGLSPLLCRRRA
jgi:hypothetical protein